MKKDIPPVNGTPRVLVPEAEERFSVAAIRSLGQAGYVVHACSDRDYAMGWGSRYTAQATRCPGYDSDEYRHWLRDYCVRNNVDCVVPTEKLLLAIQPEYDEFAPYLPISGDAALAYTGISKYELFRQLAASSRSGVSGHLPDLLFATDSEIPDESAFTTLSKPVYVKTDAVHARRRRMPGRVDAVFSAIDARQMVSRRLEDYECVLVQGAARGVGVGAFLLRWNGKVLARFMHRRLHELRDRGSSYCTSWWNDEIMADAEAKLEHLGWQGVAMMEYRWDHGTGEFHLLEMNARFWGSLHLALYAGIDFPRLLIDSFFGRSIEDAPKPQKDLRCRNVALDFRYALRQLRASNVSIAGKLWALPKFLLLSLNWSVKSDLWYPGDRRVWWLQFRQYLSFSLRHPRAKS